MAGSSRLIAEAAEQARARGARAPAGWNIVQWHNAAVESLKQLFELLVISEFTARTSRDRTAARAWAYRVAQALRDLRQPEALAIVQERDARAKLAEALPDEVWSAATSSQPGAPRAGWTREEMELQVRALAEFVRDGAAMLGERIPTRRRAARLIRAMDYLISEHGTLQRMREVVEDETFPVVVRDGRAPGGPARVGRGEVIERVFGSAERDNENENGTGGDGASPRPTEAREGSGEGGRGEGEEDGWDGAA